MPVNESEIRDEIRSSLEALIPATGKRIGECVRRLADLMNIPIGSKHTGESIGQWWERNEAMYVAALNDLPDDLLSKACREVVKTCEWFPRPAQIRKHVEEEFNARTSALLRLRTALMAAKQASATASADRLTAAEREERINRAAEIRAQLNAVSDTTRL